MSAERGSEVLQYPDCVGCRPNEEVKAEVGGSVYQSEYWRVSHVGGEFNVGSMVAETRRHTGELDYSPGEQAEMAWLFTNLYKAVQTATGAETVYISKWSHAENPHVHWLFQPITTGLIERHGGLKGPHLVAAVSAAREPLDKELAREISARVRDWLSGMEGSVR